MIPQSFFMKDSLTLARRLLGCELVHRTKDGTTSGIIVETEAYREDDEASHSFGGQTLRNAAMFGPAGHAYIYLSYGVHHCFNIVGGVGERSEAVLIRALEPREGVDLMRQRRRTEVTTNLCSGPGKLVQAMGLMKEQNGVSVTSPQLHLLPRRTNSQIMIGPRVGITKAADKPWRFFVADNPHVTKHRFNKLAVPLKDEPAAHPQTNH